MLNFSPHDVFTSGDSLREFPGQDEVTLCQQRIISYPSEIQGVRVAIGRHEQLPPWAVTSNCRHGPSRAITVMGRHERFRSKLDAGFDAQKKKTNLDGDVLLSVSTEDQTSACTTGSCVGRSRNSRTMSSAAAPEKQPPQHEFALLRGRASAGNCGDLDVAPSYSRGGGMKLPAQGRTPSRTSPAAPRKRRGR